MRIAALYDIHGNLPALEAVLEEVRRIGGVDRIVVGGDVLPGPMPRESLALLLDAPVPIDFIYGNGEIAVLDELAGRQPRVPPQYRDGVRHNGRQLTADQRQAIGSWPMTLRVDVADIGEVLFCHASPQNENDIFLSTTSEEAVAPLFAGVGAPLVICGHTHMQFDRTIAGTRVVNAGSVGMPFGAAGADWLLLGPDVQLRHTDYDLDGAAARIRASGFPHADEFADRNLLHPPSAEDMVALFRGAEIKAART